MSEARLQRQQMLGHIVLGEISNVITAMRQNAKWDTRTRMAGSPLVKNLEQLKQKIESLPGDRNIFQLDTLEYLSPFLEVIKSEETSGPITAVALTAVHKFIVRQFLGPESNNPAKGVRHIVLAVAHCRFEATDHATDEVVLMKILQVLLACLLSPAGHLLTNKLVYDMIQTCFKMSIQTRLSVLLRRSAEMTLQEMVQCVFSRFYAMQDLDPQPQFPPLTQGSTQPQSLSYLPPGIGVTRDPSPSPALQQPPFGVTRDPSPASQPPPPVLQPQRDTSLAPHFIPLPRNDSDTLRLGLDEDTVVKGEKVVIDFESLHPIVAVSPTMTPFHTPMIPRREKENKYEDSETSDATQLTTSGGEDTGIQTVTETTNGSTNEPETPTTIVGDPSSTEPTKGTGGIVSATGVETPNRTVIPTETLSSCEGVTDPVPPEINVSNTDGGKLEDSDLKYSVESEGAITEKKKPDKFVNSQGVTFVTERWNEAEEKHPFSTRVLIKLLQFFCHLIYPNARNTPSMRLLGLNLLNTIVESQGTAIADIPLLLGFVCNDMCKFLLQALQKVKKEETVILNLILRVCYNLFVSLGSYLKFQISIFISLSLHLLADESINQVEILPVEQRELILETIVQLLRQPSFVVDLYINYDCDPQLENLFGNLVEFFYKNSSARDDKTESRSNSSFIRVLSMEAFSAILQSIYNHTKTPPAPVLPDLTPEILAERKHYKNILTAASEIFNEEVPKYNLCFEFLQENKLLPTPPDAKSLALMFRKNTFLNKKNIGEFLGRNKEFNVQVLDEYAKTFDFKGKPYLQCVREFFESFRPLGESGVMERYIEYLCDHFLKMNDNTLLEGVPVSVDGIFTLTYSVILLNVDLHSPALADKPGTRMSQKQYVSNLRGLNAQKNFPLQFLVDIYDTVKNDEIKIHKQHFLKDLTDNTWYHLFCEAKQDGQTNFIQTKDACAHYDPLVFNSIWRKVIAATKFVFNTSKTPSVEKALSSFQLCALVSAYYKITPAFDNLIITLCDLSTITTTPTENFAVNFGRNEKAHMAIVALFTLTQKHGDHLRESWRNVLACLIRLHSLKLLTPKLVSFKDTFTFPEETLEPPKEPEATSLSQFIWSSIGPPSWFMGGTTKDPNTEAIEKKYRQKTKEIIKQCKLNDLMLASKSLAAPSLIYWIKVLLSWGSSPSGPQTTPGTSTPPQVTTGKSPDQPDTNAAILCLDLVTQITLLNKNRIDVIWPLVSEHFELVCSSTSIPFDHLYRAVTDLMVLALSLLTEDRVRSSILRTIMKPTLRSFGNSFHEQKLRRKISVGINRVLIGNLKHFKTASEWDLVNKLIGWTYSSPTTLADGFEILYFSVTATLETSLPKLRTSQENHTFINRDNFSGHMDLISQSIDVKDHPQGQNFAVRCLELLQHVVAVVPLFYDLTEENGAEENEALQLYWIPTLQYLVQLCHDPRLDVQSHAIATLQRALLSPELFILSTESWVTILEKILFPLLLELLKTPMIDTLSKDVIEETRLRAASILCKTFLQYLFKIITYSDFNKLWVKVLKFIEMYMNADNSELLAEAVTEALKNILMVMHNVGILRPPKKDGSNGDTEKQDELWQLSWESIDKFCPKLKNDFMNIMERESNKNPVNTKTQI